MFLLEFIMILAVVMNTLTPLFSTELGFNYTQQKRKVDTFSTLIISYTNSIDGKCHISYEREINIL